MPILFPDFDDDKKAIETIAVGVATYWNNYGAGEYGFSVFTHPDLIESVSKEGDRILGAFFPDEPGPFKRLATLLVLSRLKPLFYLGNDKPEGFVLSDEAVQQEWLPRICYLMVSPTLDILRINGDQSRPAIPLSGWNDFPSVHSKAEFFLWLEWLRDYNDSQLVTDENWVRRGRMILAASLILEAVYFQSQPRSEICGICDGALDFTCAAYESVLWENRQKQV